jgi:hypothetical protein
MRLKRRDIIKDSEWFAKLACASTLYIQAALILTIVLIFLHWDGEE